MLPCCVRSLIHVAQCLACMTCQVHVSKNLGHKTSHKCLASPLKEQAYAEKFCRDCTAGLLSKLQLMSTFTCTHASLQGHGSPGSWWYGNKCLVHTWSSVLCAEHERWYSSCITLSLIEIALCKLTLTWAPKVLGVFFPQRLWDFGTGLGQLFKGQFNRSGFLKRAFKHFPTNIWLFFISTSAILVTYLNVYLKCRSVFTFSESESSLA